MINKFKDIHSRHPIKTKIASALTILAIGVGLAFGANFFFVEKGAAANTLTTTSPKYGNVFIPGENITIGWNTNITNPSGSDYKIRLQYATSVTATKFLIADNIPLTQNSYSWDTALPLSSYNGNHYIYVTAYDANNIASAINSNTSPNYQYIILAPKRLTIKRPTITETLNQNSSGSVTDRKYYVSWENLPPVTDLANQKIVIELTPQQGGFGQETSINNIQAAPITNGTSGQSIISWYYSSGPIKQRLIVKLASNINNVYKLYAAASTDDFINVIQTAGSLNLTSPASAQQIMKGANLDISWNTDRFGPSYYAAVYYKNSAGATTTIINNYNGSLSGDSYTWKIPSSLPAGNYTVGVIIYTSGGSVLLQKESPSISIIDPPSIKITSPTANQQLIKGDTANFSWNASGTVGAADVSVDGSNIAQNITTGSTGNYSWPIPMSYAAGTHKVTVSMTGSPSVSSSQSFFLKDPSITIVSPAANQIWTKNQGVNFSWNAVGTIANIVNILVDDLTIFQGISAGSSGNQTWTVPMDSSVGAHKATISATANSSISASQNFTVSNTTSTINFIYPSYNQTLRQKVAFSVTWKSTDVAAGTQIELKLKDAKTGNIINSITSVASNGSTQQSYAWTVPDNILFGQYKILSAYTKNSILLESESNQFNVWAPFLDLSGVATSGEVWVKNSIKNIAGIKTSYNSTNLGGGKVAISYKNISTGALTALKTFSIPAASNGMDIYNSIQTITTVKWTIPKTLTSGLYSIVATITQNGLTMLQGLSNQFKIEDGSVSIISPNGGEKITRGQAVPISWTGNVLNSSFTVKFEAHQQTTTGFVKKASINPPLGSNLASKGAYSWIPATTLPVGNYKIKINVYRGTSLITSDMSDNVFVVN